MEYLRYFDILFAVPCSLKLQTSVYVWVVQSSILSWAKYYHPWYNCGILPKKKSEMCHGFTRFILLRYRQFWRSNIFKGNPYYVRFNTRL